MKPEEYSVDKSQWPDGPWQQEPDRVDWVHAGMHCLALRQGWSGHWCGYIGVPPGHPWHGKEYEAIECEVHGGLTYADACSGPVCHTPQPGEPEHLWWLGFDCAHCDDLSPSYDFNKADSDKLLRPKQSYKDISYVKTQTERLAEQASLWLEGLEGMDYEGRSW